MTPPSPHRCFGHVGTPYLSHSEPALREPFTPVVLAPLAKHPEQLSLLARHGCSPFRPQQGQAGDPWASEQMSLYSMFVDTLQTFKVLLKGRDWRLGRHCGELRGWFCGCVWHSADLPLSTHCHLFTDLHMLLAPHAHF